MNTDAPSMVERVAMMTREEALAAGWPIEFWTTARELVIADRMTPPDPFSRKV